MQQCVDAITEYQKLHALMKGELVKGLLPQSSIQADYIVQRIQGNWNLLFSVLITVHVSSINI